ncbi:MULTISPECIES: molybdate ABC transporter permease subunit [Mammaliicoccus]|uniref:Molybdenum transport system permease n=1 Tax=Mammaliicoccus fleurettii TaxID=150056 RepID=A0ABS5MLQ3_9STAP|nr:MULTISPECIES: molybdate ABC transporter permease subunit [Mammaliicoccus]HCN61755.1 molybdate ABC transporter permease subunit [Staphylococcus sp.]MBL0846389.1 molybdate ABC transporter permease subunit [Mammaliicoccus fleurettii]MBS3671465.1 molybdate ABC transporter permease subunit [Mammaliicoccus fleurettii]MBS3696581.1 molybdate ABC transporter permease subunit [Mammaliicoccus fleurettii]MDT3995818.1 molybdate ABC transporter permease subunit [Mammaliicoccus fleurettii]
MPDLTPLWISIKVTLISTIIVCILGIILAKLMFNYKGKLKPIIESVIMLPIVLPPTVMGFVLLIVFSKNKIFGQFLDDVFQINVIFTWVGAVIAAVIVSLPLMYQHVINGFQSINPKMLNSARTMGASEGKIFRTIILPLSKRSIFSGIVMSFARGLGEFGATLMVAGYIPGLTNTLPLEIYFLVQAGEEHKAWLWVIVLIAFAVCVISSLNLLNQKSHKWE